MEEKPLAVKRKELEKQLVACVNESKLPAFIISDVFEILLYNIKQAVDKEYNEALNNCEMATEEETCS